MQSDGIESKSSQVIEQVLSELAYNTSMQFESGICGDWALWLEGQGRPAFHVVTHGRCFLGLPGDTVEQLRELYAGDILFLPTGTTHWLSYNRIVPENDPEDFASHCVPARDENGLVCYDVEILSEDTQQLFTLLPSIVHIPAGAQSQNLLTLIQMIQNETETRNAGYQTAISRLSDVILLQVLRHVLQSSISHVGILAATLDESLRRVLHAVMNAPSLSWTVERMAREAYLSRSAFAERCHTVVGISPKELVNLLRLRLAEKLLRRTNLSVERIAEEVGYGSATAFIRFFRTYTHLTPNKYRAQQQRR